MVLVRDESSKQSNDGSTVNILFDDFYKAQNDIETEYALKQIEALTHFRQKKNGKEALTIEDEFLPFFDLSNMQSDIEKVFNKIEDETSQDLCYEPTIAQKYELKDYYIPEIQSIKTNPVYYKSNIPFSAKTKRFWFRVTKGKIYPRIKFPRGFSQPKKQTTKKDNLKKIIKINWMLFVRNWHDTRINLGAVKTDSFNFTSFKNSPWQKAYTYQELYPQNKSINRTLKWFLNLKYVRKLENHLTNKYKDELKDYVLNYVKNDLAFNVTPKELLPINNNEIKFNKRINKPGKPYKVHRI